MMASLISVGQPMVFVEFPDESVTGADMEWNFVNPHTPSFFRILVQAKRAFGEGKSWKRHSYRELFHVSGSRLQAETLCDSARNGNATYPLYVFYHPGHTCELAAKAGFSSVSGVNLADGFVIEKLVKTNKKRSGNNSLGKIQPHLFPLSSLFCPENLVLLDPMAYFSSSVVVLNRNGIGVPIPPSPDVIRDRLIQIRRQSSSSELILGELDIPEISEVIPREIMDLIEARGDRRKLEKLNRWRVTFVSPMVPDSVRGTYPQSQRR
ncbi:MAG: hypothetical protein OJF48_000849 [Afipia sp.]|nr:MAG: hypothetical protein OJF48_000849 [Afipia sp.]